MEIVSLLLDFARESGANLVATYQDRDGKTLSKNVKDFRVGSFMVSEDDDHYSAQSDFDLDFEDGTSYCWDTYMRAAPEFKIEKSNG